MPRFHFHTEDGFCLSDQEGTELPDLEAAKKTAVQILAETLRDNSQTFWRTENFKVIVSDDSGLTLFTLQLSAVMAPVLRQTAQR